MSRISEWTTTHRKASVVGAAVIVMGVGIGAGLGIADLSSSSPAQASSSTTTTTVAPTAHTTKGKHHGARGQITAENGSTWTVHTKTGKTVTVDISSSTQFGSVASPSTQSQFVVGDTVAAIGARSGTTVTATRVFTPRHPAGTGSTSTASG
jgi:Domain of unknown function (DUF5666)